MPPVVSLPKPVRPRVTSPLDQVPPSLDERNPMLTFEYARFLSTHSTDHIRLADAKAAVLITLLSANLLVLVQRAGEAIAANHNTWSVALIIFACAYATTSLLVAVNIIRPRVFRNAEAGHIFWEDVARLEKDAYAASFREMTIGDVCRELGQHNHNLSNAAMRKYRWLRVGFHMAITSIAMSAVIILLVT